MGYVGEAGAGVTLAELWEGPFGNDYVRRQLDAGSKRGPFWNDLLKHYKPRSVLEVGCNVGGNLQHIVWPYTSQSLPEGWPDPHDVAGVDVNVRALALAMKRIPSCALWKMEATRLAIPDQSYDLVFTCGVLIHLNDDDLGKAIKEMTRVSARYLMTIEYEGNSIVPYHGQDAALFKRPYRSEVESRIADLTLQETRWLGADDGFDDCTMYLWRKA